MKKSLPILLASFLMGAGLSACSAPSLNNDKIEIVTTIFPEYDWTREILGKNPANAEVTMLLDNGIDLHSYQPTAQDLIKISDCDLFIYVGGESDEWVERALEQSTNKDMVVINLLESLGDKVKEEEVKEGMQGEEEHDHDHEDHDHEEEEEEVEYDEHVWLSLKNASAICETIEKGIEKIDPANASTYKENLASYKAKLNSLDTDYKAAVDASAIKTLVFGDRFPFRYMVDDYGLDYYAAFVGCSAETEASFETIVFLAGKVDELGLHSVLTIEGNNHRIAETVIANTTAKNQKILTMNSLQSTTSRDVTNGTSYLTVMTENLNTLKEALK
ncbi:MAG: zinc ABC transporter substrate-binding protein [Bacilli bacterium]|nr:zinc ABC transporter substrate-binding protein [Bacilli bacterium]